MGFKQKQTAPSIINHVGYYSQRMKDVKERGMFSQLNTDARFQLDSEDEL